MYFGRECLLKVVWRDKRYKWFRVSEFKRIKTTMRYFRKLSDFHYAKCYEYDKKWVGKGKKQGYCGAEIGYFGQTYENGIFLNK